MGRKKHLEASAGGAEIMIAGQNSSISRPLRYIVRVYAQAMDHDTEHGKPRSTFSALVLDKR